MIGDELGAGGKVIQNDFPFVPTEAKRRGLMETTQNFKCNTHAIIEMNLKLQAIHYLSLTHGVVTILTSCSHSLEVLISSAVSLIARVIPCCWSCEYLT